MSVWFTSDLHLGNDRCAVTRKLNNAEEHDYYLTENINSYVNKADKLYILGDCCDTYHGFKWMQNIKCRNIEILLGNHDQMGVGTYLSLGWKVTGFRKYKDYWLSHCPIHPHEMREKTANIHGHTHIWGDTRPITDPRYVCVNPEFHEMKPVSFEQIEKMMKLRKDN